MDAIPATGLPEGVRALTLSRADFAEKIAAAMRARPSFARLVHARWSEGRASDLLQGGLAAMAERFGLGEASACDWVSAPTVPSARENLVWRQMSPQLKRWLGPRGFEESVRIRVGQPSAHSLRLK